MKVNMSKTGFERWTANLIDANEETCLKWFGAGKTFEECFSYLRNGWTSEEIAHAFMRF